MKTKRELRLLMNSVLKPKKGSHYPYTFAAYGLVLAQGAPLGFVLHSYFFSAHKLTFAKHVTMLWGEQFSTLFYIWAGTTFFFAIFGYVLGLLGQSLHHRVEQVQQSIALLSRFDQIKQGVLSGFAQNWQTPISTTLEFLDDFRSGRLGQVSGEQKKMADACYAEVRRMHTSTRAGFNLASSDSKVSAAENFSVRELARMLKSNLKTKINDETEREAGEILVEEELFASALSQVEGLLRRSTAGQTLHLRLTTQAVSKSTQGMFVYLIFEAKEFVHIDESDIDWCLPKSVIEWHGGSMWQNAVGDRASQVLIALPQGDAKDVAA